MRGCGLEKACFGHDEFRGCLTPQKTRSKTRAPGLSSVAHFVGAVLFCGPVDRRFPSVTQGYIPSPTSWARACFADVLNQGSLWSPALRWCAALFWLGEKRFDFDRAAYSAPLRGYGLGCPLPGPSPRFHRGSDPGYDSVALRGLKPPPGAIWRETHPGYSGSAPRTLNTPLYTVHRRQSADRCRAQTENSIREKRTRSIVAWRNLIS